MFEFDEVWWEVVKSGGCWRGLKRWVSYDVQLSERISFSVHIRPINGDTSLSCVTKAEQPKI
jgi:hypothetical protein